MPKSSRKSQPSKKLRSETPPPAELEDAITPELAVSASASGTSSVGEDNFVTPLPVVPAPTGKAPKTPPPARSPEPAPRLVDTANLLFAHVPGHETISFDVARGRAAHLRRRLDELHKETILGLKPEPRPGTSRPAVRSTSPPRPGTSTSQALTAYHWSRPAVRSASPCQPGVSLSSALTADQLCLLYTSPSPRD